VAQATGTSHTDTNLAAGDYFYRVTAQDAAGNVSIASAAAPATVTSDTAPPTVALTAPATASSVSGTINVTASASDDTSVGGVQFKLDGNNLGAEDTSAPYSRSWNTTGVANGPHTLTAVARDPAGNQTTSAPVLVTVVNAQPDPIGLVAAYGFEEASGAVVADASGLGNDGTLSGASRSAGRFGQALSFDGVNDVVTVADADSLDLTNALTLSAWVQPSAVSSWRTVAFKERPGNLVYGLYASSDNDRPAASVSTEGYGDARGASQLPANAWRHLAMTYDGSTLRLYLDGVQAASTAVVGPLPTSAGALTIGGNAVWDEWFQGRIDELRVYRGVLDQAAIQADMTAPVVAGTQPADTQAPSASVTAPQAGSTVAGTVQLRATASDDRGVTGVQFRVDGANAGAQDTSSPYGVSWDTTQVADGQHAITAVARDAAGNTSTSQPVTVTVKNAVLPPLDPPDLPDPGVTPPPPGKGNKPPKKDRTTTSSSLRITGLRANPKRVCQAPRGGCAGKTRLRFRLSGRARVLVVLERVGTASTRARPAKLVRRRGRSGVNRIRLGARDLRPGRYRITVTAIAVAVSRPATAVLRVR
jgi:hypothetical protein